MKKVKNIFENFRQYRAEKWDELCYQPLQQEVLDKEEIARLKRKEYNKQYYATHKEQMKEYMHKWYMKKKGKTPVMSDVLVADKEWYKWKEISAVEWIVVGDDDRQNYIRMDIYLQDIAALRQEVNRWKMAYEEKSEWWYSLAQENADLKFNNELYKKRLDEITEAYIKFEEEEKGYHNAIGKLDKVIMNR